MVSYPYVNVTGKISKLFTTVQVTSVPGKITLKWLEALGYTSKGDRRFVGMLKQLGFLDSNGAPTETYRAYRDTGKSGAVMASALKSSYPDLFKVYHNAHQQDAEALGNFFRTNSGSGGSTVRAMVDTFKALCKLADFSADEVNIPSAATSPTTVMPLAKATPPAVVQSQSTPWTININIELALPPTKDEEVYDNLFSSLKKHLLDHGDDDK
jgi:hypothetical protein